MVSGDETLFRVHLGQIVGPSPFPHRARADTIPDSHFLGGAYQPILADFNRVIAGVSERCRALWNAWASLHRLPNHGLRPDGVHLNASPNGAGGVWPLDLLFAQNVRNLQALSILDWFRERVAGAELFAPPERDWQPMVNARALYAVARDIGASPRVDIYDADTGSLVNRFLAFNPAYTLGVRVATGDTNGDGFTDIVCSTARAGVVRVISGADGSTLARLAPFGDPSVVGLRVALGDLDSDGAQEIVVARGAGFQVCDLLGAPPTPLASFNRSRVAPAVSVAVADVEGLGPVIALAGG